MSGRHLDVTCWCERRIVRVAAAMVLAGQTASCGRKTCAPFAGNDKLEAGRRCVECNQLLPAYLGPGARYCPGTVCKQAAAEQRAAG